VIEQLILVRHGETEHNVAGIAQGWNDSALSARGTQQVRALAERIASMQPTSIFSSPLQRALTTATTIGAACGLEVQTLDDLREMNYGAWENRNFLEAREEYAAEYERWFSDPDAPCPEGESHNDVLRRMQRAIAAIEESANGAPARVVVVTHGTAIRVGATIFLSAPVMSSRHLAQDNAALNLFVRRGDRWVLKLWNDTTHCHDPRTNQ
jgi:broad specificity phosphatase PhoE